MILSKDELKKIYFGAYEIGEKEHGYLQGFQYNKEQMAYFKQAFDFWFERCDASTAKTLEFTTEATEFSFEYKNIWIGSQDTVELYVDGLPTQLYYMKDLKDEGKLSFTMKKGLKQVVVYMPADATMLIRNFTINAEVVPAKKNETVLWMGDSITQGYGPLRSSHTYVSVANRLLNYDLINQGIGGYVYDDGCLMKMEGYQPDKIIVAMGTNQCRDANRVDRVKAYYEKLISIYGDTPILCVTPLWRGDAEDAAEIVKTYGDEIKEVCGAYKNITVVDGFKLVPNLPEYFLDNLHPNILGAEIYGRNLVLEIQKLGF